MGDVLEQRIVQTLHLFLHVHLERGGHGHAAVGATHGHHLDALCTNVGCHVLSACCRSYKHTIDEETTDTEMKDTRFTTSKRMTK